MRVAVAKPHIFPAFLLSIHALNDAEGNIWVQFVVTDLMVTNGGSIPKDKKISGKFSGQNLCQF